MTDPADVVVPEVRPALVSKGRAWRILAGRFVSRFVESFAVTVGGVVLFMPSDAADWQKLGMVLVSPLVVSLYQAGRGAWPAIKKWLESGGEEPPA